jgi:DNA polymerase-3 subunit beta
MKCDTVECQLGEKELTIAGPSGALSVPLESFVMDDPSDPARPARKIPQEFPEAKAEDCDIVFSVDAAALVHAISQTIFSADSESTRYALGGIMFDLRRGDLTLVATDTRRLATSVIGPVDVIGGWDNKPEVKSVVPTAFLANVVTFLESADMVKIGFSANTITIGTGESFDGQSFTAVSRLVEGRFPKYQDVIPMRQSICRELTFPRAELVESLTMALICTSEETRGVDFEIPDVQGDACEVQFHGRNPNGQKSTGKCRAAQTGFGKAIGGITFDPRYILEYLRELPKSAKYVTLSLVDSESAGVLTASDQNGQYVIMPLSRGA